jgi:hypothetical protein
MVDIVLDRLEQKVESKLTFLHFVFIFALLYSLIILFWQFTQPILEEHSFRQTQTAISTYWMIKEGNWLFYETPVLGYPWSIPFEFPIYQWMVALIYKASNLTLDESGRFLSIVCFYLSLIPIWFLIKELGRSRQCFWITSVLFLVCPNLLFWSHTFLVESITLLFCLSFLSSGLCFLNRPGFKYFILCCLFGILASLSKITTFVPASYFFAGLVIRDWYLNKYQINWKITLKYFSILLLVLIPVSCVLVWTHYADLQKMKNDIGSGLTSSALFGWNFGSVNLRFSLHYWYRLIGTALLNITYFIFILYFLFKKRAKFTLNQLLIPILGITCYLAGWLTFANLIYVHDYYRFEVIPYLVISMGLCFDLLKDHLTKKILLVIFVVSVLSSGAVSFQHYFKSVLKDNYTNRDYQVGSFVKDNTSTGSFMLIYGNDWNSSIAYYAQRKSLTDPLWGDWFKRLKNLNKYQGGLPISAVVMCSKPKPQINNKSKKIIDKLTKGFSFKSIAGCDIYYKKK